MSDTVFFDDFTSRDLDRSVWNVRITGATVNNEQQAYVDSPETIGVDSDGKSGDAHGVLAIQPRFRPGFRTPEGDTFDFISGRLDTKENLHFTYGTVEARIALSCGSGLWPAFWVLGADAQWPDCGEIDIMENVGEPDWVSAALHGPGYAGEMALTNRLYFPPGDDAARWHVYSVDWSPESILFRVDGRMLYRVSRAMVEFHGPWVYDREKYLILNFALGGTFPFKTNGVHQPYRGLPEETVTHIKADGVRMLVDWVRVTKTRFWRRSRVV
ncbi:MAG TPA: glycoside hydrolase family 16 protein [Spirochaetia bacterium]|nr:glycoside hydrolase family 16 protein [Spirochaetia bacterium]